MILKLNRTAIFFLGLAIILSYFVIDRIKIIAASDTTTGIVINEDGRHYVVFENDLLGQLKTTFNDPELREGDTVPVLYNRRAPSIAYVYTFYSFWLSYLLPSLILIIPWSAFAWGYVDRNKVVEVKLFSQKTKSGETRA